MSCHEVLYVPTYPTERRHDHQDYGVGNAPVGAALGIGNVHIKQGQVPGHLRHNSHYTVMQQTIK